MIILQANKFFHEKGGSERYLFALTRALASRGHDVVHFAMAHPRNLPSPQSRYFVPRRDYHAGWRRPSSLGALPEFVRSRDAARRMDALISERRPDVAHLHNIYHQLTPSIIATLSARKIPMVMTLHDYKLVCPSYTMFAHGAPCYRCRGGRFHQAVAVGCGGSRARSALLALEAYWQRWTRIYDRVDCFIAPSVYLRDIMLAAGIPSGRIEYVAQLAPEPGGESEPSVEEARMLDELPGRFIACAGRLSPEKGVGVLLRAMQRLPDVCLVVAGDGPQAPELRGMCASLGLRNVTFAGQLGRGAIERLLGRCAALVVPSVWAENAPMVVFEAARHGTPVVASREGGLGEILARVDGHGVPAGDDRALAAAIEAAWNAPPDAARERARRAWSRHCEPHETRAHVGAVESIYRRVMATRETTA